MKGRTKPKLSNGNEMFLRFLTISYCFSDCRFAYSHERLDQHAATELGEFVQGIRKQFKGINSNHNRNKNRSEVDTPQGQSPVANTQVTAPPVKEKGE